MPRTLTIRYTNALAFIISTSVFLTCIKAQEASQAPAAPAGQAAPAAPRGVLGPAQGFTGNTTALDAAGYTVGRRVFEAGARNATWHMHTAGQLVFGEAGRGRLQMQGQPVKELAVGESAFIPGGVFHWHGAAPSENFTMMYVTLGQSKTSQGEPVTDAVYLGKK